MGIKNTKQRSISIWVWSILLIIFGICSFYSNLMFFYCSPFNLILLPLSTLSTEALYHPLTIYLISLFFITDGIGIFFLKNWARLTAMFLGLICILSSFTYLLTRGGMSGIMENAMGHWGNPPDFRAIIITLLWFGLAVSSILVTILQKRTLFRRILLFGSAFFPFLIVIISSDHWIRDTVIEVIPYFIFPVIIGLITLAFFSNPNINEQFRVSFRISKKNMSIIILLIVILFLPYSEHCEIDINSGKIKEAKFLFGVKLYENIKDSFVSKNLGIVNTEKPMWQTTRKFSTYKPDFKYYPYYVTKFQIKSFENLVTTYHIPKNEVQEIAKHLLKLWQEKEPGFSISDYFSILKEKYKK